MTFIRPEWLLLLPLAIAVVWVWFKTQRSDGWQSLLPEHLAKKLLSDTSSKPSHTWWHALMALTALVLLVIALAGPSFSERSVPAQQAREVRVVIMSINDSMASTDVAPSRMNQAHFIIKDLLDQWSGSQVALVAYSQNAALMIPATPDFQLINSMLPQLTYEIPREHGDNLAGALNQAKRVFERADVQRGQVVVVADHLPQAALNAAGAWNPGIDVNLDVVKVGTSSGIRPVTDSAWQALASRFSGVAVTRSGLDQVTSRNVVDDAVVLQENFVLRHDSGIWFVVAAMLPLLLLIGQRQIVVLLPFGLVLLAPQPAQASWFDNREQQAQSALAQEQYEQALNLTEDVMTRGMALYQQGKYEQAIEAWRQQPGIDSVFNQGVAYARLQNYDAAAAAFEAILQEDPDHVQAAENLAALEDLQNQQAQQNQQGEQNSQDQQSEQNQEPSDETSSGNGNEQSQQSPDESSQQQNSDGGSLQAGENNDIPQEGLPDELPEQPMGPVVEGGGEDIDSARMMSLEPPDPARLIRFRFNQATGDN
ncbi:VWA domain-containing protein [Salinibius halmophilus]|uniref:VWA domain-containing protein n=1 Tax=Salinibius halmophilus TaxID=1853216 RepID=UPI000E65F6AC|nr:VWA domain-containing protein [Salinibius halmophilus]